MLDTLPKDLQIEVLKELDLADLCKCLLLCKLLGSLGLSKNSQDPEVLWKNLAERLWPPESMSVGDNKTHDYTSYRELIYHRNNRGIAMVMPIDPALNDARTGRPTSFYKHNLPGHYYACQILGCQILRGRRHPTQMSATFLRIFVESRGEADLPPPANCGLGLWMEIVKHGMDESKLFTFMNAADHNLVCGSRQHYMDFLDFDVTRSDLWRAPGILSVQLIFFCGTTESRVPNRSISGDFSLCQLNFTPIPLTMKLTPSQFEDMLHSRDAAVHEEISIQQSVDHFCQKSDADRLARWEYVRSLGLLEPAREWYNSGTIRGTRLLTKSAWNKLETRRFAFNPSIKYMI